MCLLIIKKKNFVRHNGTLQFHLTFALFQLWHPEGSESHWQWTTCKSLLQAPETRQTAQPQ